MEILRNISARFWSPDIWLPPNTTWADLTPTAENKYIDYRHLIFPIPMSMILLGLRYVLERCWFAPIGKSIGIKNTRPKKAPPNIILEKAYTGKKIKHKQVLALAKQLDWSERQVERWLRLRRSQDKPSTLTKFCENSWRCLYYTYSFIFGLTILWDKPWLWKINNCYYEYPFHPVSDDIWWYYMISMAFYWSLSFSQFFDVKRKDFWQMFVHHIATIVLMCFSWVGNLTRIGSLVLLVHDCADIFLEAAKMAKYANYQKLCDFIFVIFTVLWIVTRMGVYPFWIIYSTTIEAPKIVPMFPAYYIFNALLSLLLVLHAIWTWLILKIAYNAFYAGQLFGRFFNQSSRVKLKCVSPDVSAVVFCPHQTSCYPPTRNDYGTHRVVKYNTNYPKPLMRAEHHCQNMEGDIRSSSSEDVSDSLMNASTSNNTNDQHKGKVTPREKQH